MTEHHHIKDCDDLVQEMENSAALNNKLLQVITKAQSEFITNVDARDLFAKLLENLLAITESEYGFIGEVLYDADGVIYLKTHAITNIAWDEETLKLYEENAVRGLEFRNLNSLFGTVMTTAKPLISNAPANDPRAGGIPKGHPPLNSFMGLPFFSGKKFIGMVGIANRLGGYDQSLIRFLHPFLTTCANLIQAFRNDQKRILAEKSLRQSETKNRTILDTVASGIITINKDGLIHDFNPAAEGIFGYTTEEVIGRNVNMLMPEPYRSHHTRFIRNYLETGVRKVIDIGRELLGKRKDETIFPMELTVNEMHVGDEHMFVGMVNDITLRKQAEASLIAAKEAAEEANRLKSDFLNIISHELRTPLTVILGNIPLLTNPKDMPEPEEISEIAKDIETDGHHLLALINDLLDISKIEAGKMQVHRVPLSAARIVAEAVDFIRPLANQKQIGIEIQTSDMEIHADPLRMKQILLNLLGNAVKFTDTGNIIVQVSQASHMAQFEVRDTGIGIDEADLPYIFEVFRQGDSSSTRKVSGTGLGLSITKRLIELHSGEISVKSQVDKGSIFRFSIPLYKVEIGD